MAVPCRNPPSPLYCHAWTPTLTSGRRCPVGQVGRSLGRDALLPHDLKLGFCRQRGSDQLGSVVERGPNGRECHSGPRRMEIAVQKSVELEGAVVALPLLGRQVIAGDCPGRLDLQPVHLACLTNAIAVVDRREGGIEPRQVLFGDFRLTTGEGETFKRDREIAPDCLCREFGRKLLARGVSGRDFPHQVRPAMKRELFIQPIYQIALLGGLEASRARRPDPERSGRILPGADGCHRGIRRLNAGTGGLKRRVPPLGLHHQAVDEFRGDCDLI